MKTTEEELLEYLEAKYDRKFIPLSMTGGGFMGGNEILFCYAEGSDPELDRAEAMKAYPDGNHKNKPRYHDSYFGILVRDEIEGFIKEICTEVGVDADVYYNGSNYFDNKYDHTKTYADVRADWGYEYPTVRMFISDANIENSDDIHNAIVDEAFNRHFSGSLQMTFVSLEVKQQIDRSNWREYYDSTKYFYDDLIDKDGINQYGDDNEQEGV
jgi:hypothetical protein